eukprot:8281211-Karenia_brevis.AAC.1
MEWPRDKNIDGSFANLEIHRITELLIALDDPGIDAAVLTVPTAWIPSDEFTRSAHYQHLVQDGSLAQAWQLKYWNPVPGVPPFDVEKVAGTA